MDFGAFEGEREIWVPEVCGGRGETRRGNVPHDLPKAVKKIINASLQAQGHKRPVQQSSKRCLGATACRGPR